MLTTFNSWNAYEDLMRKLSLAPTGNLARRAIPVGDNLNFNVKQTNSPYQNNPGMLRSTFIRNIRYMPNSNYVFVHMGTKDYPYYMSLRRLSNWLNYHSLGQYYNKYVKLK
jgi:hypothetical protein